jgi:23S rRNA (uracil1939-C5)-methyltransferase
LIPVEKNQEIEIEIDDVGAEGQGIGKYQGYAVFVPGALPGERARVHIVKAGKAFGVGKLLEVVRTSADRVVPPCPAFGRCGGCTLMHLSYEAQLKYKQNRVRQALRRIGGLTDPAVLPVWGMGQPWRYRNKGAFCAGTDAAGAPALGLYAARSHRIVPVDDCAIEHAGCADALRAVSTWVRASGVSCYDENSGRGLLRHVVVRTSTVGDVMVIICTNGDRLPGAAALANGLKAEVKGLRSVVQCVNRGRTNVILDGPVRTVWGEGVIREALSGLRLELSPRAFFQVNPEQAAKLYAHAVALAQPEGDSLILDAYCGIGAIGLLAARAGARVVGVECVEEAVRDAERNAALNGIGNARFVCGLTELVIPEMLASGEKPDAVILDPPRKGCEPALLGAVADAGIARVVYVSCNPATLARDMAILHESGYTPGPVQPVDMFPHTAHVETVVLMSRAKE